MAAVVPRDPNTPLWLAGELKSRLRFAGDSPALLRPVGLESSSSENMAWILDIITYIPYTVKPRYTAEFGGKETSAVNRGSRYIGVSFFTLYM